MALSLVFLMVFLAVASVDGFYFHLWKYRLHERPASRYEHLLHTINAVLLLPQIYLMFCVQPRGAWLVLAALLAIAVYGVELFDVLCENDSRRDLGGLTSVEYAMHFSMGTARAAFVMPFFAMRSLADFGGPAALDPVAPWQLVLGLCILAPAAVAAGVHVMLAKTGGRARARSMAAPL